MAEQLTRNQLQDVLDFSEGLVLAGNTGVYSPWLQNTILNNLNNNPKMPKMSELQKALNDYKNNAEDLQEYNEFMQHFDMLFTRTIQSYANILSFDLQVVCTNAFTDDEYKSEEYKKDKQKIDKFLDAFDYKAEFRKVLKQIMTTEVGYYWLRKTKWGNKNGMKGTLQIMPQKYCMLTDYWEKGLLYDFDMTYFLQAGVDINGFDPVFKKYYNKVFGSREGINNYIPTNPLAKRDGTYALWTQTSPTDGAWAKI